MCAGSRSGRNSIGVGLRLDRRSLAKLGDPVEEAHDRCEVIAVCVCQEASVPTLGRELVLLVSKPVSKANVLYINSLPFLPGGFNAKDEAPQHGNVRFTDEGQKVWPMTACTDLQQ